jgi:hypothetical protein
MRGRFAGVFAAVVLAMGWSVLATSAHAQLSGYTFTILADNGPGRPFQSFYVPTMNACGEVVFAADLRSGGAGIYRWGGSPQALRTVFEEAVPNLRILDRCKACVPSPPRSRHQPSGRIPGVAGLSRAAGRPGKGQSGPGQTRGDVGPLGADLAPRARARVTGEESRAALPWADGPLGWRAALTAECGFHATRYLHRRLVSAVARPERATAVVDRSPAATAYGPADISWLVTFVRSPLGARANGATGRPASRRADDVQTP